MELQLKRGLLSGGLAGIVWGLVALVTNGISGAFPFEGTVLHNIITFTLGGAVFGLVVGGSLVLLCEYLPFKNIFSKTTFLSTSIWLMFFIGGAIIAEIDPTRYYLTSGLAIQGVVLAIFQGLILGFIWERVAWKKDIKEL